MEASVIDLLEKLFYKKIMLYNDLLYCFKEERESLININLDKLWGLSKEKDEICLKIRSAREEMLSAVDQKDEQQSFSLNAIMDLIPGEYRANFHKLYLRILKLKSEVEILRQQNMIFIDDSLKFMDEMISIISGETESRFIYNDQCHLRKSGPNLFLNREV